MKNLFLLAAVSLALNLQPAAAAPPPIEAKWLVAHNAENEPILDLLHDFSATIEKKTDGRLRISVVTAPLSDSGDTHPKAFEEVAKGAYQLSQISIRGLAKAAPNLMVLDMPYLFTSYTHSAKVLDGPIGTALKNSLLSQSKNLVRGLDFTYSGGYRKLFSSSSVRSMEDLRRMSVRVTDLTPSGEMNNRTPFGAFFNELGIKACNRQDSSCQKNGVIMERELNRFAVLRGMRPDMRRHLNVVVDTDHSLFLTLMVANEAFLNGLPDGIRHTLVTELHKLAKAERALSVQLEQENRRKLAKEGVEFISLPERERMLMEIAGQRTQSRFKDKMGETIQAIKGVKVKTTDRLFGKVKDHTLTPRSQR